MNQESTKNIKLAEPWNSNRTNLDSQLETIISRRKKQRRYPNEEGLRTNAVLSRLRKKLQEREQERREKTKEEERK